MLTEEEKAAVLAKVIPRWLGIAARAKAFGIDIVNQPPEHFEHELFLYEAGGPDETRSIERPAYRPLYEAEGR